MLPRREIRVKDVFRDEFFPRIAYFLLTFLIINLGCRSCFQLHIFIGRRSILCCRGNSNIFLRSQLLQPIRGNHIRWNFFLGQIILLLWREMNNLGLTLAWHLKLLFIIVKANFVPFCPICFWSVISSLCLLLCIVLFVRTSTLSASCVLIYSATERLIPRMMPPYSRTMISLCNLERKIQLWCYCLIFLLHTCGIKVMLLHCARILMMIT